MLEKLKHLVAVAKLFMAAVLIVTFAVIVTVSAGWLAYLAAFSPIGKLGLGFACSTNETGLSCARDWASVAAIIFGAITIIYIRRQVREQAEQHRQEMSLQTYPVRALFSRAMVKIAEPLAQIALELRKVRRMLSARQTKDITPSIVVDFAKKAAGLVGDLPYKPLEEFDDGTIRQLMSAIETHYQNLRSHWVLEGPSRFVTRDGKLAIKTGYKVEDGVGVAWIVEVDDLAAAYADELALACEALVYHLKVRHDEVSSDGLTIVHKPALPITSAPSA
ncbi:MAG TPA: hypothetical protein VMF90_08770 [Rhizobiaceae bacterium]|nr:hypothetical protein [Rhizobiaceae bacterium]